MTKAHAIAEFETIFLSRTMHDTFHLDHEDGPAFAEAWNNFTDTLRRDSRITKRQYSTWTHPARFSCALCRRHFPNPAVRNS